MKYTMNENGTVTLVVPERFLFDHFDRDLGEGIDVVKCLSAGVRVTATGAALNELCSDAWHYSDCVGWANEPQMLGLQMSAKATVRRLEPILLTMPEHTFVRYKLK